MYNEVESYKFDSGEWKGPFVYFAGSRSWYPSYWSFYTAVWSRELDQTNFDEKCYSDQCLLDICESDQFCRAEWTEVDGKLAKEYYCCPEESSDIAECVIPGKY